jgi:hypothetical protein
MNAGLSNPRRSVMISIAILAVGVGGILWGIFEMDRRGGAETNATALAIGVGLLLAILGCLFTFNFIWAVRLTEAMKRGENVIARWTVPAQTLEEFRINEAALKQAGRLNDWKVPRKVPPNGVEVIFSPSAVMIGDSFFGLAKGGLARFTSIQMVPGNPLAIGFGMALTTGRATSGGAILTTYRSELRIPVARTAGAEASKVLTHYTSVDAGRTIVKPGFWALRGLNALKVNLGLAPLVMAVVGVMVALGGAVLAAIASAFKRGEREDRTR